MNFNFIILALILLSSCKNNIEKQPEPKEEATLNLVEEFSNELEKLNKDKIHSLDLATDLFKTYAEKTKNFNQRDSLFLPYFDYYNLGRTLLLNEDLTSIEKYGFSKKTDNAVEYLVPTESNFLKENVIIYLSKPMRKFTSQQLKEFNDDKSIGTIAENTIWWEDFNKNNSAFFLKEMTAYHYRNWHLKNLISGTEVVKIFDDKGYLEPEVRETYENLVNKRPNTETAQFITEYLQILSNNNFKRTEEIKKIQKLEEIPNN